MADLTSQLLPRLQAHRLSGFDLGQDFIYPAYEGYSLLNLPASLCLLFGVPGYSSPPLVPEFLSPIIETDQPGRRRILLFLVDALSLQRLRRWLGEGRLPALSRLAEQGVLAPLTSILPSTTSTALTSLWTGLSPAEHGVVGYELWLKEYGMVANMILHAPMSFHGEPGSLERAGFNPKTFLNAGTLGAHLAAHGVKTHAFQHISIARSGLSRMLFEDLQLTPFHTLADLFINLRQLLESRPAERLYAYTYYGELDHLSHIFGPDDERAREELVNFSQALERLLLKELSSEARRDTLLILTADHGQVKTRPDPFYDLGNHASMVRRLHILPTGENRLPYLFIRPGQIEAVREYIERTWMGQFLPVEPAFAASAGLFGPGKSHPRLLDRLGDLLLFPKGEAYLWWGERENHLIGRHGGLSPDEMLVPFLAARL